MRLSVKTQSLLPHGLSKIKLEVGPRLQFESCHRSGSFCREGRYSGRERGRGEC